MWCKGTEEGVKVKAEKIFGRYTNNLLFIFPDDKEDRDLRRVWFNFQEFSVNNTFFVTGNKVVLPKDQETSLIQLPEYRGEQAEESLQALEQYLGFFQYKRTDQTITTVPQLSLKINWKLFYGQFIGPGNVEDLTNSRFK